MRLVFAEHGRTGYRANAAREDRVEVGGIAQLRGARARQRGGGEQRSCAGVIRIARGLSQRYGIQQRRVRRRRPCVHLREVEPEIEQVIALQIAHVVIELIDRRAARSIVGVVAVVRIGRVTGEAHQIALPDAVVGGREPGTQRIRAALDAAGQFVGDVRA